MAFSDGLSRSDPDYYLASGETDLRQKIMARAQITAPKAYAGRKPDRSACKPTPAKECEPGGALAAVIPASNTLSKTETPSESPRVQVAARIPEAIPSFSRGTARMIRWLLGG